MLPQYMTATTTGVYRYRRRTPQELKDHIGTSEIIRSLGKDQAKAITKAMELNQSIDQSVLLVKMKMPSALVSDLLAKVNLTGIQDEAKKTKDSQALSSITQLYLDKSKGLDPLELSNMTNVYKEVLPNALLVLFKESDPDVNDLTYDRLLKVSKLIEKLPNRNFKEYKRMSLYDLMSKLHKNSITIPEHHQMSPVTSSKIIKRIKSLLLFAQQMNLYTHALPRTLTKDTAKVSDRDYKSVLAPHELSSVFSSVMDADLAYVYKVLYFTGMRRSELYKCRISEIEGIPCFDLRSPKAPLKTKASYRVIPVHSQLMNYINKYETIVSSLKPERMTKVFTRVAKAHLSDPEKKTMYSLRHTFATNLIAKGTPAEIVSDLMGHEQATITLNRYVKGFPIATLKSAIETL